MSLWETLIRNWVTCRHWTSGESWSGIELQGREKREIQGTHIASTDPGGGGLLLCKQLGGSFLFGSFFSDQSVVWFGIPESSPLPTNVWNICPFSKTFSVQTSWSTENLDQYHAKGMFLRKQTLDSVKLSAGFVIQKKKKKKERKAMHHRLKGWKAEEEPLNRSSKI